MMKNTFLSLACVLVGAVSMLNAHQVVTQKVDNNKYEMKFWAHDKFDEYKPSQVISAKAYDDELKPIKAGIMYKQDGKALKVPQILSDKKPSLISSVFDAGYWVHTSEDWLVGDKSSMEGIIFSSIKSIKIGKSYYSWNPKMLQPLGLAMEVIALNNPLSLKVGDYLPVLVLKDGKPLANAGFETDSQELDILTNEHGIALIPIKHTGLNIIAASYEMPTFSDPLAEKMLFESSIDFEVK